MPILSQTFFRRPALTVALELLGKLLVRTYADGSMARWRIFETEAYDGEDDLASHASRGKTDRNAIMYEPGGVWYVYLVYGMYHMLNIVTGISGYPSAVLIRGAGEVSGPGRLTQQLLIDRTFNTKKANKETGLWIEDDGYIVPANAIVQTPRIGVAYAREWAEKPYRFVWRG